MNLLHTPASQRTPRRRVVTLIPYAVSVCRPELAVGRAKDLDRGITETDMTRSRQMLEAYPKELNVDAGLLARAIEVLEDCASTCTQYADSCLSEREITPLAKCIRLNLYCADVCVATARVTSRRTAYDTKAMRPLLVARVAACRSCGDECEHHAEHLAHCRVCAENCRQCEQACRELLAVMT